MRYSQYKYSKGRYGTADLLEGASAVSSHSSIANVSAVRVRTSGALAASTTVIVTESFTTVAGAGAFSSNVTTTCAAQRIQHGGATSTVASTITGACERIRLGNATDSYGIYGVSTIVADSELILIGQGTMTSTASITVNGGYVQFGASTMTSTASVTTLGRLKWSPITEGSEIWTLIAA
jgi:hypothetical protein